MNTLLHSIRTAAPCWVAIVLVVAILVLRGLTKKKKGEKQDSNYGMEGMCLGMCFGTAIGIGISLGMLIGLAIGLSISKKPEDGDK